MKGHAQLISAVTVDGHTPLEIAISIEN